MADEYLQYWRNLENTERSPPPPIGIPLPIESKVIIRKTKTTM
jgi:hypothetical protein